VDGWFRRQVWWSVRFVRGSSSPDAFFATPTLHLSSIFHHKPLSHLHLRLNLLNFPQVSSLLRIFPAPFLTSTARSTTKQSKKKVKWKFKTLLNAVWKFVNVDSTTFLRLHLSCCLFSTSSNRLTYAGEQERFSLRLQGRLSLVWCLTNTAKPWQIVKFLLEARKTYQRFASWCIEFLRKHFREHSKSIVKWEIEFFSQKSSERRRLCS
jgi:hypothetical protein